MNLSLAHIHVMINHIPVMGTIFLVILMVYGLVRKSNEIVRVSFYFTVALSLATVPVYLTGDPAKDQIRNETWFERKRVDAHEEMAEKGFIAVLVTGALAIAAIWMARNGGPVRLGMAVIVLFGLLVSAGLFGVAALKGGEIRHDEIRVGAPSPPPSRSP
jgi:uncharacterized membrane protein